MHESHADRCRHCTCTHIQFITKTHEYQRIIAMLTFVISFVTRYKLKRSLNTEEKGNINRNRFIYTYKYLC